MNSCYSWRAPTVRAFAMIALFAGTAWPRVSVAEGALAVGLPADVAKEGFAYGYALNQASAAVAREGALKDCRTEAPGVDKRAQALCAVVDMFRNQCFAVSMDPKDATPGAGWAIAASKRLAENQAVAKCRATAGESRRDFCEVSHSGCDGGAQ